MTMTKNYTAKIFEKTIEHDGQEYTIYVKLVEAGNHKTAYVYMTNTYDDYKLYWAATQYFNRNNEELAKPPYNFDYNNDEEIAEKMAQSIILDMDQTLRNMAASWYEEDENFVDESILNM